MKKEAVRWLACALVVLSAVAVAPQNASAERVTVVMWQQTDGAPSDLELGLYNALRAQVEAHSSFGLNDVPRQSLQELLLVLGCTELDATCSELLGDVLDSSRLAWAEVREEDGSVEVDFRMWNIADARLSRSKKHALRTRSSTALREALPVLARSLLYGDDASIQITSDPEGARVLIDGEEAGFTPLTLENRELGYVMIEVSRAEYQTRRDAVLLDIGTNRVDWTLQSQAVARTRPERDGAGLPPAVGWSLVGAGGAALIGGTITGISMLGTQSDFDDLTSQPGYDRDEAVSLRDKGQRQARLTNILMISGAVLGVTGAVLLLTAPGNDQPAASDESARQPPRFEFLPHAGLEGGGVDLRVRF